ncbi:MAG TPA: hypothetical protein VGJ05_00980 [Fimbriiglobus sp.]|jgi:hypothetical protein
MNPDLACYAILAWLIAVVIAFPSFRPHRGILVIVLSGTLFLPEAVPHIVKLGPIKLNKLNAISYACLLASFLFDFKRLLNYVPSKLDWPVLLWCLWPLPSVMLNAPPPDGSTQFHDAVSQLIGQTVSWGVPFFIGRVYFGTRESVRDLAIGAVIAATVYAPLCLWEIRLSPQLHMKVYGYMQHDFIQTIRFGGFRPMVFMQHGLAVGLFMVAGALLIVWLRRPAHLPGYLLLLVPVAVLVKSVGAIVLGFLGGVVLLLSITTATRWWLILFVTIPLAYVGVRTTGIWSGKDLVEVVSSSLEAERAGSIEFRLENENLLIHKALDRPIVGWGGWGRNRVKDTSNNDVTVTDGMWVIILGERGLVGLALFGMSLLLPVYKFAMTSNPVQWRTPVIAPYAGFAVVVAMWAIDDLFNAMPNPLYLLMAGALAVWDPVSAGESSAEGSREIGNEHAEQKDGVADVPSGQPKRFPGNAVQPFHPDPLNPRRGSAHPAG